MIRQITIIGTGLIGGSFALAVRRAGFAGQIVGCDSPAVLDQALAMKAIDRGSVDPVDAGRGSQLIVLATPVGAVIDLIRTLGPGLANHALLTDVGSTKSEIQKTAARILGDRAAQNFLGGHPMAGKERSGLENVDATLFDDATWFLTPMKGCNPAIAPVADFLKLLKTIGARTSTMEADQHDRLCAWISHVPQMLSTALAATLVEEFGDQLPLLDAGGRALREMTRISSSPYSVWRDIALTNKNNLAEALLRLEQRLAHIRENLGTRELEAEFEQAHRLRKSAK